MYEAMYKEQQTTLDKLEAEDLIKVVDVLKRKWKVEILGNIFLATSLDEMGGGAGKEIRYDRNAGWFSSYSINGLE